MSDKLFVLLIFLGLIGYHFYKKSTREVTPPPAPAPVVAAPPAAPVPQPVVAPVAKPEVKPAENVVAEPVTAPATPVPPPAPAAKPYFPELDTIPVLERKTIFENIVYHYNKELLEKWSKRQLSEDDPSMDNVRELTGEAREYIEDPNKFETDYSSEYPAYVKEVKEFVEDVKRYQREGNAKYHGK